MLTHSIFSTRHNSGTNVHGVFIIAFVVFAAFDSTRTAFAGNQKRMVPVEQKRAMTWGQPAAGTKIQPGFEELAVPDPDGFTSNTKSPQEQTGELSLDALSEPEDISGSGTDGLDQGNRTEIIRQRYPDGKVQVERHVMQDETGSYRNHGPWILKSQRGDIMARGQFELGRMTGNWQRWHPVGSGGLFGESPFSLFRGPFLSTCGFAEGKLHGQWTVLDQQRRKILEIPYTTGKRDGIASWYWPNGVRMRQVQFVQGELNGDLIEWDRNNRVTRRVTFDRNRELLTRQTWFVKDQPKSEYHFLGAELEFSGDDDWWNAQPAAFEAVGTETQHGAALEWHPNGQLRMRGQFKEGMEQDEFAWWHENGQKQIAGSFVAGARQGKWRWWHANGSLAIEGDYHQDKPIGEWTWWDENGKIANSETMTDGSDVEELEGIPSVEMEGVEAQSTSGPVEQPALDSLHIPD